MHNDELLVHEHLALHSFRSPYSTSFRAKPPSVQLLSSHASSLPAVGMSLLRTLICKALVLTTIENHVCTLCRRVAVRCCGIRDQWQMGGTGHHNNPAGDTRRQAGRRATSAGAGSLNAVCLRHSAIDLEISAHSPSIFFWYTSCSWCTAAGYRYARCRRRQRGSCRS